MDVHDDQKDGLEGENVEMEASVVPESSSD